VNGGGSQIRSYPTSLTPLGSTLYLAATTFEHGTELMKTDPASDSLSLVKDIVAGTGSGRPTSLCAFRGILFFNANDGVHGEELWRSDGTEAGTYMLADLEPGLASSQPGDLRATANGVVFIARDSVNGSRMWSTNGTVAGTGIVSGIRPYSAGAGMGIFALDSKAYVLADLGLGMHDLYVSDGSAAGTVRLCAWNVFPFPFPSFVLGSLGSTVFFVNGDATHGAELWTTDGTPAGTALLLDIAPGPAGSSLRPAAPPTAFSTSPLRMAAGAASSGAATARPAAPGWPSSWCRGRGASARSPWCRSEPACWSAATRASGSATGHQVALRC
jgi:ELWxxDGT repeat protein